MESPDVSELIRRLENLLRPGTIEEVDVSGALVRVRNGSLLSTWVRWFARRAGAVREWSPPTIGEQCLLLAPGGDPANAVALVGLFSEVIPANDSRATTEAKLYPDGTLLEYNHESHRALLQCVGDILLQADANIKLHAAKDLLAKVGGSSSVQVGGSVSIQASGALVIESATSLTLRVGASEITLSDSGISGTPDLVVSGISVVSHVHDKVRTGTETSGRPV
ncbi:phage baseplate assembly protein V [Roseateles sp. SL47]|uniref:phage baseplate assembly protein V n=1 Tax=Roseateles sp. SL47 TaxID=2995138 RepID=UPI00226EEC12|nr:phage baseplate assembly protein V [Roseateles sp. SL47]WAC70804.1 phage baseplate assembly protein V [Roseateles sp. SL47]